jgi:hypothetical protein
MRPHLPSAASTSRPSWMLLAMALPVGMLLDRLTGGWENLSGSILMLMGWQDSLTLLQRHTAGMVSHLVVPALLVFMVLKATRLGAWLAPNGWPSAACWWRTRSWWVLPCETCCLLPWGEPPFVSGTFAAVATPVVMASLAGRPGRPAGLDHLAPAGERQGPGGHLVQIPVARGLTWRSHVCKSSCKHACMRAWPPLFAGA